MTPVTFSLWAAAAAFAVSLGFAVAAVAGRSPESNVAVAVGSAAGIFPFVVLAPVRTWSRLGGLAVYHGSMWAVSLAGAGPWLVFALTTALVLETAAALWRRPLPRVRCAPETDEVSDPLLLAKYATPNAGFSRAPEPRSQKGMGKWT